MNVFGDRIAWLREQYNQTQEELAAELGISRASLSHYERGRRSPDFETLNKLADLFKVSIDYLVGRVDSPNASADQADTFIRKLDLTDDELLERYALTIDNRELTREEAKRFIAFIRAERSIR